MIDFTRDSRLTQPSSKPAKNAEVLAKNAYAALQKADTLFATGKFSDATNFYKKSLEAYRGAGDSQGTALSLARLGRAEEILGEYDKAREVYKESLKIFENLSDLQGIARSKAHLGNLCWATGDYHEAAKFLDEALHLYCVGEDIPGQAWVHDLMGNLRLAMRDDKEAERLYLEAYSLVEDLGVNLENSSWNHFHLGTVALFREDLAKARERFLESFQIFTKVRDDLGQVVSLIHLGEIACTLKEFGEAEQYFQMAITMALPTQCKPLLADALVGVAQLLKAQKNEKKAISILMVALSHPTCRQQTKDRMVDLVMHLESSFSRSDLEGGFKWAKELSIEDIASSWVSATAKENPNKARKNKRG